MLCFLINEIIEKNFLLINNKIKIKNQIFHYYIFNFEKSIKMINN